MKNVICVVAVCVMAVANIASSDTIQGINIDFVTIGNAGNAADTQVMNDGTTNYGAVGYTYRIGTYEVTNAQWNTFTAAAGKPTGNQGYAYDQSSYFTGAQQPTNGISWYEAAQFCNYLTSGDKSKGAYQFTGNNANPGYFWDMNRAAAISTYGTIYVIPTENEWYKAAYFKPDGSDYSLYANDTSTAPIAGVNSNYKNVIGAPWNVGTGTMEQNGTYDMMGNVWEWNETQVNSRFHGLRGGSRSDSSSIALASYYRNYFDTLFEDYSNGFRVVEVPEPATLLLLGLGGVMMRRRK